MFKGKTHCFNIEQRKVSLRKWQLSVSLQLMRNKAMEQVGKCVSDKSARPVWSTDQVVYLEHDQILLDSCSSLDFPPFCFSF